MGNDVEEKTKKVRIFTSAKTYPSGYQKSSNFEVLIVTSSGKRYNQAKKNKLESGIKHSAEKRVPKRVASHT